MSKDITELTLLLLEVRGSLIKAHYRLELERPLCWEINDVNKSIERIDVYLKQTAPKPNEGNAG